MLNREELTLIVKKAQSMDPDAMNTLFAECRDPIYYFALRTVKNPDAAEDVAQEAMLDIFRNLDKLKDPAAFQAWSREITYRQCLHYIKKVPDVLAAEDEDGHSIFDTLEEENTDFIPDAAMESKEFQQTIQYMVATLPDEQRAAILLYHFDGLSVKEIAQIQQVPENTVKSRLMYGRKAIRSAVEAYEKKNGVKLHSFAILPFLAWFFAKDVLANALPQAVCTATAKGITAATGVTLTTGIAGTAASAAAGTATAAGSAGTAVATAKAATIPLAAKIACGVAAVGIAAGGVALGLGLKKPEAPAAITSPQYECDELEIFAESHRHQGNIRTVLGDGVAQYLLTEDLQLYDLLCYSAGDTHSHPDPETNLFADLDVKDVIYADNTLGYVDSEDVPWLFLDGTTLACPEVRGQIVYSRVGLLHHVQIISREGNFYYSSEYDSESGACLLANEPWGDGPIDTLRFYTTPDILATNINFYMEQGDKQMFSQADAFLAMDQARYTDFTLDGQPVRVRFLGVGLTQLYDHPIFAVESDEDNLYFSGYSITSLDSSLPLPDGHKISQIKTLIAGPVLLLAFDDGTVYTGFYREEDTQLTKHAVLTKLNKDGHILQFNISDYYSGGSVLVLMDDNVLYRVRSDEEVAKIVSDREAAAQEANEENISDNNFFAKK